MGLNKDLALSAKLFSENLNKSPTRNGMGEGVVAAADANDNVVGLCADLTESTRMHLFAERYPERFVQVGVAEQNLVTVAAGLAGVGKIPFASSYAAFMPGRCWEQIRTTICYNNQPVKLIGAHAGLMTGPDGATHQMLEDLALMRVLPNMTVLNPCDVNQARAATLAAVQTEGPVYIRVQRAKSPVITTKATPFEIGKAQKMRRGKTLTLIATGPLVYEALLVGEKLNAEVINVHTLKPLDAQTVLKSAKKTGKVMTLEEHQVIGGLGGAVAELLSEELPTPLKRVGMYDQFGESGEPYQLLEHFGLLAEGVEKVAREFVK